MQEAHTSRLFPTQRTDWPFPTLIQGHATLGLSDMGLHTDQIEGRGDAVCRGCLQQGERLGEIGRPTLSPEAHHTEGVLRERMAIWVSALGADHGASSTRARTGLQPEGIKHTRLTHTQTQRRACMGSS